MTSLNQDQIKTLEQSRQRLIQLTHSLASLITSLNQSDPLPSWTSLQSQATIISNNLLTISDHLSDNRDLLSNIVAYPDASYPSRIPANNVALEQVLRTKLDPRVEDWVARGRRAGAPTTTSDTGAGALGQYHTNNGQGLLSDEAIAELWDWAPVAANEEARKRNWGGNYTLEEREMGIENVVTGLSRVLEDDDEEDESDSEEGEGEADEMEVVGVRRRSGAGAGLEFDIAAANTGSAAAAAGAKMVAPVVPLDEILRFMTTGAAPGQR
ncbi:mediator of RNA polymerase II transcription subunit 8 [Aspergillus brasiliensis]|uniref:Mediator of RNA polymerase II transcription subunit 8 n=1 Tax=Aspergillus brasiliensis TaxID=319629 RepID=A0A9W6DKL5_9EURO|nr:mediator of RNA polymerase II transcription subunit 8 [Aspergillus brasiliensis]GKZ42887.1 mediator of RNA polymerase II transcription subunit 8 [Aspergillus brasiliensis]